LIENIVKRIDERYLKQKRGVNIYHSSFMFLIRKIKLNLIVKIARFKTLNERIEFHIKLGDFYIFFALNLENNILSIYLNSCLVLKGFEDKGKSKRKWGVKNTQLSGGNGMKTQLKEDPKAIISAFLNQFSLNKIHS